jgi:hypothetical protein
VEPAKHAVVIVVEQSLYGPKPMTALTLAQVAERLGGVSVRTLKDTIRQVGAPFRKVGKEWLMTEDDYRFFLEAVKCRSTTAGAGNSGTSEERSGSAKRRGGFLNKQPDALNAMLRSPSGQNYGARSKPNSSTGSPLSVVK